ncbi:MAG TPA: alpha/beta fold hydrolase [Chroococcidiopsis sp.]
MPSLTAPPSLWHNQLGFPRDWVWRGWQVRYTHLRAAADGGLPILLLHGFGSSFEQWHKNLVPLSQRHTVYAMDFVGFGRSEKAAAAYKVQLWADQVYDFWRSHINRPILLVGHSLGALVALTATIGHPEMVKGLVMLTLPEARRERLPQPIQAIAFSMERLFANPLVLRPAFSLIRRPGLIRNVLQNLVYINKANVTDDLVSSFLNPAFDRGAAEVFCRLARANAQPDYSPEAKKLLAQLATPTLLIWGQQDRVVPLAIEQDLLAQSPHLEVKEIPNAGHCLYDECADLLNAMLLEWASGR